MGSHGFKEKYYLRFMKTGEPLCIVNFITMMLFKQKEQNSF